jgi:hypothetical protein
MEEAIPRMLEEVYLNTEVSINQTIDSKIILGGGAKFRTSELEQGLWEDTACTWQRTDPCVTFTDLALSSTTDFDYAIEKLNHLDMTAPHVIRAIVAQYTTQRAAMFLVIASNDLKMVFDDIDSRFVQMYAVSSRI